MSAYYNEIDPYAAQWLRNLIEAGLIAPGVVDERSIEDVEPRDLIGFTQCHFFAGLGGWSYALRNAGWPDSRPVWTGSCPCQPFSAAGAGGGFAVPRHLWPSFAWLIEQSRPAVVFGEQVASKNVEPWVDLVHTNLEAMGYAFGAVPFPSAGVGAPHIRDRIYWVADAGRPGLEERLGVGRILGGSGGSDAGQAAVRAGLYDAGRVADTDGGNARAERQQRGGEQRQQPQDRGGGGLPPERLDHPDHPGPQGHPGHDGLAGRQGTQRSAAEAGVLVHPGPVNGFWTAADWLGCRDGRWRPVEAGTFPLAHGVPARVGKLRAYGNAVNAQAAQVFVEAFMER
jgi:DNA (cytosine-5)-methyltransferase 1